MKKIISLLLLTVIAISCSSDDSNSNSSSTVKINPPAWIQGLWIGKLTTGNVGFKFTTNDFCQHTDCWRASIEASNVLIPNEADKITVVEVDNNEKTYKISMVTAGVVTKTFEFRRKNNVEIIWTNAPEFSEGNVDYFTYTKQ